MKLLNIEKIIEIYKKLISTYALDRIMISMYVEPYVD